MRIRRAGTDSDGKSVGPFGRCPVVARDGLAPGEARPGPLIVESPDTTVVVPPAWRLSVEAGGLIVLERPHA